MYHLKKKLRGHTPKPPSKAHGFAMRSRSLCDVQISKSEKQSIGPLPNPGYAPDHNCFVGFFLGGGEAAYYERPLWGGQEWALAPSLENHKMRKSSPCGEPFSSMLFFPYVEGGGRGLLSLPLLAIIFEGAHASYGDTPKPLEQRALQYHY